MVSGLVFSVASLFPTGAMNGENVTRYQPIKMAAMEGLFKTQEGAPIAIIGMPDTERRELMDPIYVPRALSYLAYGDFRARVVGPRRLPGRTSSRRSNSSTTPTTSWSAWGRSSSR